MRYPYSYVPAACRQRYRLDRELRARLDELVLNLSLDPMIGCYDRVTGNWYANLGAVLRVAYRIVDDPQQLVVVEITRPDDHRVRLQELRIQRDLRIRRVMAGARR